MRDPRCGSRSLSGPTLLPGSRTRLQASPSHRRVAATGKGSVATPRHGSEPCLLGGQLRPGDEEPGTARWEEQPLAGPVGDICVAVVPVWYNQAQPQPGRTSGVEKDLR